MKVLELACVAEEEERRRLHSESHHQQQQQLPMVRTVVSRKGCARAAAAAASVSSTPCLLLLLALALITHTTVSTVAAIQQEWRSNGEEEDDGGGSSNSNAHSFASLCSGTLYPELCTHTLTGSDPNNPQTYLPAAMKAAMGTVNESLERVTELITKSPQASGTQFSVLEMCRDVLRESVAQLNTSLCRVHAAAAAAALNNKKQLKSSNVVTDIQHYASAALTYHSTCITGIAEYGVWDGSTDLLPNSSFRVHRSIQLLSNALALVNGIVTENSDSVPSSSSSHNRRKLLVTSPSSSSSSSSLQHLHLHRQRRNAHVDDGDVDQELLGFFPSWLSKRDRRLLQATMTTAPNANAIVALDGSGEYTSVQAAVDAAPSKSSSRWVIYIKGGVYNEYVNIAVGKPNLMFVGDGAGVTILTGSKSVAGSQVSTYYTATLGIMGTGFIAKDMTIQNTAGIEGQQAVALRVSADKTAFQGLSIEGYQDTLYSHVLRQFYSQCTILGTIDFIFGNSAAVFQSCNLLAHLGAGGQQNTYTASGRTDPGQQTGFSFLSCTVDAAPDLAQAGDSTPTYLGRPWKPYAVTVFINSVLGSVVNPAGWLLWDGNPNSGNNVLYGEYGNTGPGSGTSARVSWSQQLSITQAQSYTVGNFITGDSWLPATSIPFYDTL